LNKKQENDNIVNKKQVILSPKNDNIEKEGKLEIEIEEENKNVHENDLDECINEIKMNKEEKIMFENLFQEKIKELTENWIINANDCLLKFNELMNIFEVKNLNINENIENIEQCINLVSDIDIEINEENCNLNEILNEQDLILKNLNDLDNEINKLNNNQINKNEENSIENLNNYIEHLSKELNLLIISINNKNKNNFEQCDKLINSNKNDIPLNKEIIKIYNILKLIEFSEQSLINNVTILEKKIKKLI
jgi:hypothetical protein